MEPQAIWPSRYGADGKPNRGPGGRKPLLPPMQSLAACGQAAIHKLAPRNEQRLYLPLPRRTGAPTEQETQG